MGGLQLPHHRIKISAAMHEGLRIWLLFIKQFNRVSFWHSVQLVEVELQVHSDAAGGHGFEVYFQGHCCAALWPPNWLELGIT